MDPVCRDLVLSKFESHAKKIGAGIVYISHDKGVIKRCDTVINLTNKIKKKEKETEKDAA